MVKGNNIRLHADNEITLSARSIRFESTGSDETFVIRSKGNMSLEVDDTLKIDSSVAAIGGRSRMFIASSGPINIKGKGGVSIVEPRQTLIPTSLNDVLNLALAQLFPGYF